MDAAIIGAGPAGSISAILLGKRCDVVLFEEHQSAGFPVQCAGLISDVCFEKLRKYCRLERALDNVINGAFFFSPSGKHIEAKGKAYVVERKILDRLLLEKASENAEVSVKDRVKFRGYKVVSRLGEFEVERIVGADGVYSTVARYFGFQLPDVVSSIQAEMRFEALDENYVELYFGSRWSNSFFAYAIPLGETARIGVLSKDRPLDYFKNLIEKHPSVSKRVGRGIIELNCGGIPKSLVSFAKERVALIGDAAGMVKPYTGGGLYYLLVAAEILAKAYPNLKEYERLYLKELGEEYRVGQLIRKLYSLPDEKLERIFEIMADFDFSGVHMDRPSTLMKAKIAFRLLKNPSLAISVFRQLIS